MIKYGNINNFKVNPLVPIIGTFYSTLTDNWLVYNFPLWFITCLFVAEVIFYLLNRITNNKKIIFLLLASLSIAGFLDSIYSPLRLPWSADIALTAAVFLGIGNLVRGKLDKSIIFSKKIIFLILFFIINFTLINLNIKADMALKEFGNYFYFYIAAFAGIFFYVIASKIINKNTILSYIGKNTFIILAFHVPVSRTIIATQNFLFNIPKDLSVYAFYWAILYLTIQMILLIPVIYIMNKFFPFVLRSKKK
jgi:fucose 4-O-acetylase-like acetyltransferase